MARIKKSESFCHILNGRVAARGGKDEMLYRKAKHGGAVGLGFGKVGSAVTLPAGPGKTVRAKSGTEYLLLRTVSEGVWVGRVLTPGPGVVHISTDDVLNVKAEDIETVLH